MGIRVESNVEFALVERWLQDSSGLDELVEDFRQCTVSRRDWTHRAHLGVAASLILTEGAKEAMECLRGTIPRLNEVQGGENSARSGYHETLTLFWVRVLHRYLRRLPARWSRLDKVRAAVEAYGEIRRLDRAFYSFDVLACEVARAGWSVPESGPPWLTEDLDG